MFNLLPKATAFYDLFEGLARHAISCAEHLRQLSKQFPVVDNQIQLIRQEEHDADDLMHRTLERLDQRFITPFDRGDILELVNGMDDIIDAIDALAKRFPIFHIDTMPPEFRQQTDILVEACIAMSDAVHRLRTTRKLSELKDVLIEIHRLESVGDDVHHAAISRLFDGQTAPLEVIKWKELYDYIEEAIDGCEDVGNTLERIVLKHG
jgi:predicted phosphate transport protein (TIGR00153 family)